MGWPKLYTMRSTFEDICHEFHKTKDEDAQKGITEAYQGIPHPWVPLGNFMNYWYSYSRDARPLLVRDPLPEEYPADCHPWACFCAASAEWFCSTYGIEPLPEWVFASKYILAAPWYMENSPGLWQGLREETALEFTRRNIFCGNRLFLNKYERDEQGRPLRSHPIHLPERRTLLQAADARYGEREKLFKDLDHVDNGEEKV